jgi:hypothetical protein
MSTYRVNGIIRPSQPGSGGDGQRPVTSITEPPLAAMTAVREDERRKVDLVVTNGGLVSD